MIWIFETTDSVYFWLAFITSDQINKRILYFPVRYQFQGYKSDRKQISTFKHTAIKLVYIIHYSDSKFKYSNFKLKSTDEVSIRSAW